MRTRGLPDAGLPLAITWLEPGADLPEVGDLSWPTQRQVHLIIGGDRACWHYDSAQISPAALHRWQQQLNCLIAGILAEPERPLGLQPLMSAAERQQVLVDWNQTRWSQAEGWSDRPIHQLFEAQAERTPHRTALQYAHQRLTYGDLNRRANQLAHLLIQAGLEPGDRVGIHLERSLNLVVALLAVLKAGGAYLPLDPTYPQERLALMVEEARPRVLLTQSLFQRRFQSLATPDWAPQELCLDRPQLWKNAAAHNLHLNPNRPIQSQHLAYMIYTSGSTGRPKGVMIEHSCLSNFAQAARQNYGIGEQDRVLQFASISFDAAAEEIYPCLISGGSLVLRTPDMISSIPQFLDHCQALGLTVLDLPTAYWHLLVAELDSGTVQLPPTVRLVIIGGEAVNPRRVLQWQQMLWRTGCRAQLLNTYGPTEATVVATAQRLLLPQAEPPDDLAALPQSRSSTAAQCHRLCVGCAPAASASGHGWGTLPRRGGHRA
ncbi:MAG: AMP-binding protein, partial [Synechococcales cyanobacterium RM1_1_8]|nr:AMP-binding protein [Synechococcales cyanobacterium RM1_1_8]